MFASWTTNKERLCSLARALDPSIQLYTKDNWLCKTIAWILFMVSFGQLKPERFLKMFATTLAHAHFYPKEWDTRTVEKLLIHEAEHTKQFRRFGLNIHPLCGLPIAALLYLASPLPIFLCWGRMWMELGANVAFWKYAMRNLGWSDISVYNSARFHAFNISGPAYIWAWPRPWAEKIYRQAAEKVVQEYEQEIAGA